MSVASEFPVGALERSADGFACTLTVALPSGEHVPFNLEMRPGYANHVVTKERALRRLPMCCPERHIVPGGLFCMNWIGGDPQPVIDTDSARTWWASLWDYLTRQEAAAKIRRWPGPVRAHGAAAIHQDRAERCATKLGHGVLTRLAQGDFKTRVDQRRGRNRIELLAGGEIVNRIHVSNRTLTNHQMRCLCINGVEANVNIERCEDHAMTLALLIDALYRWTAAEREYIAQLRAGGTKCCHTLDHCPLK